jgi:hypothetical protein
VNDLAGLAALLSIVFAVVVGARWLRTRRPHFLFWALGLLIFAAAATAQSLGESQGFEHHVLLFRTFYLLGGALGVIYLALGTLYLLAPRRVADIGFAVLLLLTVVVVIDAFAAPVDDARLASSGAPTARRRRSPSPPSSSTSSARWSSPAVPRGRACASSGSGPSSTASSATSA